MNPALARFIAFCILRPVRGDKSRMHLEEIPFRAPCALAVMLLALAAIGAAHAQDKGTVNPQPLPALAHPSDPALAAKELFGRKPKPAPLAARSIGFYAKGCLAGAVALPINGRTWQVMRLSRNRSWGHPNLIRFLEHFAVKGAKVGWPGLLVGDISQPRGGPMLTGHASHQVGLDADIWLTPMPNQRLTEQEREDLSTTSMLAPDGVSVDPKIWTDAHFRLLKRAASYASVERISVHPAIKKARCEATAKDADRTWLHKMQAYWGHYYHFHVRIACPEGSTNCEHQQPLPNNDGCSKELTNW